MFRFGITQCCFANEIETHTIDSLIILLCFLVCLLLNCSNLLLERDTTAECQFEWLQKV